MSSCGIAVADLRLWRCLNSATLTARMLAQSTKSTAKRPFRAPANPRGVRQAQELAQDDTQVEPSDVYQVPLGDVGSTPEADSAVPARFEGVGKASFDQFAALALQRLAPASSAWKI